jgi:hypothetical protein
MQRLIFEDTTEEGKEVYVQDADRAGPYPIVALALRVSSIIYFFAGADK